MFVTQEWLEAADIRAELFQYLKEQVPQNFCLDPDVGAEEDVFMQANLLHPLECLLFGEDPRDGLEKLKQGCSSSQLCGRVFKEGETVYSCRSEGSGFSPRDTYWFDICMFKWICFHYLCRDCAIDPTCVMCMDCFQGSVHKSHRYKVGARINICLSGFLFLITIFGTNGNVHIRVFLFIFTVELFSLKHFFPFIVS